MRRWFHFPTMIDLIMIRFFLRNIWHFSVIAKMNHVSIFSYLSQRYMKELRCKYIVIARWCRVQCNMNACREHYKNFEWKRLRVANNTNVLNGKEYALRTLPRFQMKENASREHYIGFKWRKTLWRRIWNYTYEIVLVFNIWRI